MLDRKILLTEIGDLRWYIEDLLELVDSTIEEIEMMNDEKLRERFPFGFSIQDSVNRSQEERDE